MLALLALVAAFLILTGALAWMAAGRCSGNEADDPCLEMADSQDFRQALWLSWGVFFDPGTQTGLPGKAPAEHHFVLLVFSVFGFLFNLVVLGLIVALIIATKDGGEMLCSCTSAVPGGPVTCSA